MRLSFIFILAALMQVSALTKAQKITLSERNASLEQVLKKISAQSNIKLLYADDVFEDAKKINLQFKELPLESALEQVFKNQQLSYELKQNTIVISKKTPSFLDRIIDRLAAIDVRGRVVDSETGQGLPGATVSVKGSAAKSTKTNAEGEFYLQNVDEGAVILIAYVGYKSQELTAEKMMGMIKMEMGSSDLQEVTINKGYYSTTQKLNTGNVRKVTAETISKQPVTNPLLALQGRVPGLHISQSSGAPGSEVNVSIRGRNSIANGNDPLYVVDGVAFISNSLSHPNIASQLFITPFESISPNDIESIEVLKDADATSIYGSRGANGVILITTKKGVAGKTSIDISAYSGITKSTHIPTFLNTPQYVEMRKEAFKNDGVDWTQASILARDIKVWDTTSYTNWPELILGGTGHLSNVSLSASGGSENTSFLVGGTYNKTTTIFPGEGYDKGLSVNMNVLHYGFNKKLRLDIGGRYDAGNNFMPSSNPTSIIKFAPTSPAIYNENGELNWANETWENPYALLLRTSESISSNLNGFLNVKFEIVKGLNLQSSFGYTIMGLDQTAITPLKSYRPSQAAFSSLRTHRLGNTSSNTWVMEPQLNYKKSLGAGLIEALVGLTFQDRIRQFNVRTASDFVSDEAIKNFLSASIKTINFYSYAQQRKQDVYARIGYSYKQRYVFNITGRRDGSTRFGASKRYGNFGAAGAAWIFSEEHVVQKNMSFLSFGKLRASYGITGNDQMSVEQEYLDTYSPVSTYQYLGKTAFFPTRLANPEYGWEQIRKLESAIDLGFFKNRINLSTAYYINKTNNQLVGYPLSTVTGFPSVTTNLPAIIRNSGLEMDLTAQILQNNALKWSSSLNISFPRNKLISYPNIAASSYNNSYMIGKSLFVLKRFLYTGVDPQTGLYTVQDVNADGVLNITADGTLADESTNVRYPKYFGGWSNTLNYGNLELDLFFHFANQRGSNYNLGIPGFENENQMPNVLGRWQKPGDRATVQKYTQGATGPLIAHSNAISGIGSNFAYSNASFIRLKNLAIAYNLPLKYAKTIGVQSLRIYVQCQNVFTLSPYDGIDPETQSASLPPVRTMTAGLQLKL